MTDKTSDALTQLYAQASAEQTPHAPPALSATILQAATQAVAMQQATVETPATDTATAAATDTAKIAPPAPASALQRYVKHLPTRLRQLTSALTLALASAFTLPTLRYGLPAMMVAAVGFKVAITDTPQAQDAAAPMVAAPAAPVVAAPAAVQAPVATAKAPSAQPSEANRVDAPENKVAVATKNTNAKAKASAAEAAPSPAIPSAPQAFPAADVAWPVTGNASAVLSDGSRGADEGKSSAPKSALGERSKRDAPMPVPAPPATIPVPMTKASTVAMGASAVAPASPTVAPAAPMPTTAVVASTSSAGIAVATAPAPAPAPMMVSREPTSGIPKELRLRFLISNSRMVNGVAQEFCNATPPDLERVRAWLATGASPAYVLPVPNAISTLALARQCGFDAAVQVMQAQLLNK